MVYSQLVVKDFSDREITIEIQERLELLLVTYVMMQEFDSGTLTKVL